MYPGSYNQQYTKTAQQNNTMTIKAQQSVLQKSAYEQQTSSDLGTCICIIIYLLNTQHYIIQCTYYLWHYHNLETHKYLYNCKALYMYGLPMVYKHTNTVFTCVYDSEIHCTCTCIITVHFWNFVVQCSWSPANSFIG